MSTNGTPQSSAEKDSKQTLATAATSGAIVESSSVSSTVETSPLALTTPSETGLTGNPTEKPNKTKKPVSATSSSSETTTVEDVPAAIGSNVVIGDTTSGTSQVLLPASDVENTSKETAESHSFAKLSSSPEPEFGASQASENITGSKDSSLEANIFDLLTAGSDIEDLAPTPEDMESTATTAPETGTFPTETLGPVPTTPGPAPTSKDPITISATGGASSDGAFGSIDSVTVSDAFNNDPNKESEIAAFAITPDPRPSEEGIEEEDAMDNEALSSSPESEKEFDDVDAVIPKSPGRPPLTPSPPGMNNGVVNLPSTGSSGPKSVSFDGPQKLTQDVSTNISPSQEPEDFLLPEASPEAPRPIGSVFGSMLDSLPVVEMSPAPTSFADETDDATTSSFALVDSLPSFHDTGIIGPMPLPTIDDSFLDMEDLEGLESLEPTPDAFDVSGFLEPIGEALMVSNEPEVSGEPEMSEEPEASMEEILPSGEIELEDIDLIVKHPDSLDPIIIAEEIRLSSNELTQSIQWDEAGLFLVSNLSKFGSAISVVRQADQINTFELNLQTTCLDPLRCDSESETYRGFIRDGKMDETLSARDLAGVNVFLKGDIVDRSTPPGLDITSSGGLSVGVIVGIAIGAVASVSLLVFGVLFVTKRGHINGGRRDPEQGRISSYHGAGGKYQSQHENEEEGSFMISYFGGSPRNTEALIPWMSNSSEGSANKRQRSATSFTTVDTAGSAEIATNYLTNYRFEETASSGSSSDFGDLDVEGIEIR